MSAERDLDAMAGAIEAALDERVRPLLKMHGGDIQLTAVEPDGRVRLRWLAACTGCPLRPLTAAGLLRPELEAVEGVTAVDAGFAVSAQAARRLERVTARARS